MIADIHGPPGDQVSVNVSATAALDFVIEREDLSGPVNIAAPKPLPNAEFMRVLREAWGMRYGLPATRWMLELGAWAMRTETELVLKSRRVVPGRLLANGFEFRFPDWPSAARDLCDRWRVDDCGKSTWELAGEELDKFEAGSPLAIVDGTVGSAHGVSDRQNLTTG